MVWDPKFLVPTIFIDRNNLSGVETAVRPAGQNLVIHVKALEQRQRLSI